MSMKMLAPAMIALTLCLAGCGGRTGNDARAGEGAATNAASNAAAANGAAPAGPCPFEIRDVRAVRSGIPDSPPGGGAAVYVSTRPDAEGRQPQVGQRMSSPPDLVIAVDRDPAAQPQPHRDWSETGIGGYPATPDYTHAVVRCAGNQVARVPIQP
jgi:hypothetical protein